MVETADFAAPGAPCVRKRGISRTTHEHRERTLALTLYYSPRTRATRVAFLLEELGVPYERVVIDLGKGENKTYRLMKAPVSLWRAVGEPDIPPSVITPPEGF